MTTPDPHSHDTQLDALVAHYIEAIERGETPNREKLIAEYPALADGLRRFFADYDRLQHTNLQPAAHQENPEATFIPQHEPQPGTIFGCRYKLLQNIGEGGMGSVWVAEQKEPVKRKVAIKLVKAGMDSKQVLARFEAERQALAMMDHPNIAKVFDGGITEHGRPYFVMEYVKGVPFTEYCDKARLSLKERLNLFIPVCQAVQHAHHKGIVHRDLKPSNILICLYDGKPVPKVIDFGLAKAMHQQLTEQSIFTAHGVMVGTPLYMSPEQAEHNNLDVDTRTDIYSLGVVLYELLTGTTPLEREQLRTAAYNEVLRLIKEVEPPRPSTRLSGSDSLPSIAAQRSIDPRHLQKSVAGDLDWIVMKSLEKERTRRYETATGLAKDVERFLNEEAVEACPPSRVYRLKKLARKHRGKVIAAITVLTALLVASAGATWGWFKATQAEAVTTIALTNVTKERDSKEEQRKRAMAEKARAEKAEQQLLETVTFAKNRIAEMWVKTQPETMEYAASMTIMMELPDKSTTRFQIMNRESPAGDHLIFMPVEGDNDIDATRGMIYWMSNSAIESFADVTAARAREATRADEAERLLISGLLRPIGYGLEPNTAELRSFVDWSAISDVRLKLRILEVAVDNPDVALRLARRAERAIQSCVGLSPTRRAKAIELMSAKQRDMNSDPRIRVAAVWLALELGSTDSPALPEALVWLSDSNSGDDEPRPEFREFVYFMSSRVENLSPEQITQCCDTIICVLEKTTDSDALRIAGNGLVALAPTVSPEQITRGQNALIGVLEKTTDSDALRIAGNGLVALAPTVSPEQITRGWNALIGVLEKTTDSDALRKAGNGLVALAPKLSPEQITRGGDALIGVLEKTTDSDALQAGGNGLVALAPKLSPEQITRAWDALIGVLEKPTVNDALRKAGNGLVALAPKLGPEQITRGGDALIGVLEKSTDSDAQQAAGNGLVALAPKLSPEQILRAWDAMIGVLEKTTVGNALQATGNGLVALAPKLSPEQITRGGDALIGVLEKTTDSDALQAAGNGLVALAPKLSPEQITRAWDALIGVLEKSTDSDAQQAAGNGLVALAPMLSPEQITRGEDALIGVLEKTEHWAAQQAAGNGLVALAPKLSPEQITRAWDALIGVLEKSTDSDALQSAGNGLVALAPKLSPEQNTRAWDALIGVLEKTTDSDALQAAGNGLVALAPKLSPEQITRGGNALIGVLEKTTDIDVLQAAGNGLVALAPKLSPDTRVKSAELFVASLQRIEYSEITQPLLNLMPQLERPTQDRISNEAMTILMDYLGLSEGYFANDAEGAWAGLFSPGVMAMTNARSLASLLQHSAATGPHREFLLQRFEELVFHDGKHVLLPLPKSDEEATTTPPADAGGLPGAGLPPRQFHNLHHAAAWIQQNWPDFDLDATHPVTWRGEM